MHLVEAAKAINAQLIGKDILFTSVGTDSRNISTQQLFVALRGEHFDGHEYGQQALEHGASAVMVSQSKTDWPSALLVKDTRLALGELASYWRSKFTVPIVAITGSSGKTTVKEMLAAILRHAIAEDGVLATQGNLNNDIGLPLTLLKLRNHHQYAVVEMGMNHMGEIAYLAKLGRPDIALINNAGSAHIGELGSLEAIAQAKGEIFQGLAEGGTAIINADDDFAPFWQTIVTKLAANHVILTFGLSAQADVSATYQLSPNASSLQLRTPQGTQAFELPVAGLHNVRNALAAAAAALALGIKLTMIAQALSQFGGVKGRLQHRPGLNGAQVIDDTYNANPVSMKAAIDVLAAQPGEKIMVMGDMGELGSDAPGHHAEVGNHAKQAGIDRLFTTGELSALASKAFGTTARHFDQIEALVENLKPYLQKQTTVLVKGSRFMRMERVVHLITIKNNEERP